ncbi:hypothetical protein FB45DRAFT_928218 [Roridomyces roridus]|uniref:Uncharacterized protein n=1 Tax=Roridomyces roridus TaxID=1738132 RepID=A0AAD7BH43_9AGAR|nr:hypothetical protein FB45DRAFT_928218 [Roridomyces roridus]
MCVFDLVRRQVDAKRVDFAAALVSSKVHAAFVVMGGLVATSLFDDALALVQVGAVVLQLGIESVEEGELEGRLWLPPVLVGNDDFVVNVVRVVRMENGVPRRVDQYGCENERADDGEEDPAFSWSYLGHVAERGRAAVGITGVGRSGIRAVFI